MKYLDEYRDPVLARRLLDELREVATAPWTIMEVCGGQTHTIVRQGIDELLPAGTAVDVVKIDVEGAECRVLDGMSVCLANQPDVVIEITDEYLRSADECGEQSDD